MIGGGSDEQKKTHDDHEIETHLYNIHTINGVDFVNGKECKTGEGDLSR